MPYKVSFRDLKDSIIFQSNASLCFLASIYIICFGFSQADFYRLFPFYTIAFLAYIYLCTQNVLPFRWLIILGIIVRISLLLCFPQLSDDIYRFYWDGRLIVSGLNPYGILPMDVLVHKLAYLDEYLFSNLNSPEYYTIYPPVSQLYFGVAAAFGNIDSAVIVLKILLILSEIMGLYFLLRILKMYGYSEKLALIYFLNPLIIIEGVGNLHFEVVMIATLCASLFYIFNHKLRLGALFFALSVGIKLLPLMFFPFFWFKMDNRQKRLFFGSLTILSALMFLPVLSAYGSLSILKSANLYFQKFEFNGSLYYVLRWIGEQLSGYNLIHYLGPGLAIMTLIYNLIKAKESAGFTLKSFMNYALLVWTVYLFLATTVHPWYVSMLVFLCVFSSFRYPIVWSYLIFLTYVNYSGTVYYENFYFVLIEYSFLISFLIFEFRKGAPILSKD